MRVLIYVNLILWVISLNCKDCLGIQRNQSNGSESHYSFSNVVFNSVIDTLKVFPKRFYSKSRNYYEKDSIIENLAYWKFYNREGKFLFRMANPDKCSFSECTSEIYITRILDYNFKEDRWYVFEDDFKEIFPELSAARRTSNIFIENDSLKTSLIINNDKSAKEEKLEVLTKDYAIKSSVRDSLTCILYNNMIVDSIKSQFRQILPNSLTKIFDHTYSDNYYYKNDSLFIVSIPYHCYNYDSINDSYQIGYFEIYSINKSKMYKISDDDTIIDFLEKYYTMKNKENFSFDAVICFFSMETIIDNTIIFYDKCNNTRFFYDYINKKFFDPVIKVIDD